MYRCCDPATTNAPFPHAPRSWTLPSTALWGYQSVLCPPQPALPPPTLLLLTHTVKTQELDAASNGKYNNKTMPHKDKDNKDNKGGKGNNTMEGKPFMRASQTAADGGGSSGGGSGGGSSSGARGALPVRQPGRMATGETPGAARWAPALYRFMTVMDLVPLHGVRQVQAAGCSCRVRVRTTTTTQCWH